MVYCMNCGVELAPSESKCPLCGASILRSDEPLPNLPMPLPSSYVEEQQRPRLNRRSLLLVVTICFALPIILCFVCDLRINGEVRWAGFAAACLVLVYVTLVVPLLIRVPSLLQLAIDCVGVELLLYFIANAVHGRWFQPFALPVILFPFVAAAVLFLLHSETRMGGLDVAALTCLTAGIYCVFIEWRINTVFALRSHFIWAQYPFFTLLAITVLLIAAGRNRHLRESLARRFFI